MSSFGLLAALMTVAALCFVLPPLWRRNDANQGPAASLSHLEVLREQLLQLDAERDAGVLSMQEHAAARAEVEMRVAVETPSLALAGAMQAPFGASPTLTTSRRAARPAQWFTPTTALVALAVPAIAVSIYLPFGSKSSLVPAQAVAAVAPAAPTAANASPAPASPAANPGTAAAPGMDHDIREQTSRLAQRLSGEDRDAEGWALLARSYGAMQRFEDAAAAFARATALAPRDAQLLADHADALAVVQGSALGEPQRLIDRALRADPRNLKALALAGSAAYERGEALQAAQHWERARELAPADSPFAAAMARNAERARAARAAQPPRTTP
jgi:cytochrome c-type biogenesis protein CcmH